MDLARAAEGLAAAVLIRFLRPPFPVSTIVTTLAAAFAARGLAAGLEDAPVRWRAFGREAFEEAAATRRPVFLVLTAPWTWDHFLLSARLFDREEIRAQLDGRWIPVLADASIHPELRRRYAISTGLLPSFHFLDATGRAFASSAPLGPEELAFRLDEWRESAHRPSPEPATPTPRMEVNAAKLANRSARYLTELSERGELPVARPHEDIDPGALLFLAEAGETNVPKRAAETLAREIGRLRSSALMDSVDGGFHRAAALADLRLPHFEKTLLVNARMGALLAIQFRRTGDAAVGRDALLVLRFLNEGLRIERSPLYAESMAADLYDARARELIATGREYYARSETGRRMGGWPPKSTAVTTSGNAAVLSTFAVYAAVFDDARVVEAARRMTPKLLAQGFAADGSARAGFGSDAAAGLRGQAEAGLGLLAAHTLTGSRETLAAAERLASALVVKFLDESTGFFRDVASDAGWPDPAVDPGPDPVANGRALRFLAELAAMTREKRWLAIAQRGVEAWAADAPADGRGLGELGAAALRVETPPPLLLLRADPGSEEAERLFHLALRLADPWLRIRWLTAAETLEAKRLFEVELEERPALYLVWGGPSAALRDADVLGEVYRDAAARAAGR